MEGLREKTSFKEQDLRLKNIILPPQYLIVSKYNSTSLPQQSLMACGIKRLNNFKPIIFIFDRHTTLYHQFPTYQIS